MKHISIFTLLVLLIPLLVASIDQQVYIVYFGKHSGEQTYEEIEEYHHSYLYTLKETKEEAKNSIIYSYKNSINGFAAVLTADEALKLSELDEVVSVFPSKVIKLHTTRSWEFLDVRKAEKKNATVENELLQKAKFGKQIVVGLLDTGIWPESKSFNDEGMGPIPKKWKGICQHGDAWNSSHCNKKIIGARYYLKGYERQFGPLNHTLVPLSPRDVNGHGTHTSSTVGGRIVHAKKTGGFAHGTASGGAPLVHLAMYKVCWSNPLLLFGDGCTEEDILAAFDDAISDGVDIISISLGFQSGRDYINDVLAIGSLHAVKHNIVISCSAGNSGPGASSVDNYFPWVITVAANSIDRAFSAPLRLGNGMEIPGQSLNTYKLEEKMYPLVYAGDIEIANVPKNASGLCNPDTLSPEKAKGKIVLCVRRIKGYLFVPDIGEDVKSAGGAGVILANSPEDSEDIYVDAQVLPATGVGFRSGIKIRQYINSTRNPMAYISPVRTVLNIKPAPYMASFSSRGPNLLSPDILKPDITAPGINILAAYTGAPPTTWTESSLTTESKYELLSGTSMSCPHVAAVAVLIKAIHPTWSSAAIRSAIMTTAVQTNNMNRPISDTGGIEADPFMYGSGHIHPTRAADPGLVYDASYTDYLLFLCKRYGKTLDKSFKCPPNPPSPSNLNYPSLAISKLNATITIERVVTNVGDNPTIYVSQVEAPPGVYVKVLPSKLTFQHVGEKKRFTITVEKDRSKTTKKGGEYVFGWYSWSDGVHVVRSPMAINLA